MRKYISIICALALGVNLAVIPAGNTKNAQAAVKVHNKTMYAGNTYSVKVNGGSYKTSNKKVVFVNKNGKLTAKSRGTAVITVKSGKKVKSSGKDK